MVFRQNGTSPDSERIGEEASEARQDTIYQFAEYLLSIEYQLTTLLTYPYSHIYTQLNSQSTPQLLSINSQLSTINYQLSTLNNQLSTLHSTLHTH